MAPVVPAGATETTITINLVNYATQGPAAGINVQACGSTTDLECQQSKIGSPSPSDAMGKVTLTVPVGQKGFTGYLEITDPNAGKDAQISIPYLVSSPRPITEPFEIPRFFLVNPSTLDALHKATGTEINPELGQFSASAFDCSGNAALTASLKIDKTEGTTPWYLVDPGGGGAAFPSEKATAYDGSNLGGFFNVKAERIKAEVLLSDDRIGSSTQLFIRKGYFSSIDLRPNQFSQ